MLEGVPVTLRRARRLPAAHPAAPVRHRGARHGSPFCRGGENSLKASGSVADPPRTAAVVNRDRMP